MRETGRISAVKTCLLGMLVATAAVVVTNATAWAEESAERAAVSSASTEQGVGGAGNSGEGVVGVKANLQWENTPVGGARIVDSRGKTVVTLTPWGSFRKEGDKILYILIGSSTEGFYNSEQSFSFYYASEDCTGPRLLLGDYFRFGITVGDKLIYAGSPLQKVTVKSEEIGYVPGKSTLSDILKPGTCRQLTPGSGQFTAIMGAIATFDLSTLGFVLPFHLEF